MSGPLDAMTFSDDALTVLARDTPGEAKAPVSAWHFDWDANKAAAQFSYWDVPGRDYEWRSRELQDAAAQLARATGKSWTHYQINMGGAAGTPPYVVINEAEFWRDLEAARKVQPDLLKDLGANRAAFDKQRTARQQERIGGLEQRMAKGGWIGNLAGGALGGFTDPLNVGAMLLGPGAGKGAVGIAKSIIGNGLVNLGVEAAEEPFVALEREAQGRELTAEESRMRLQMAFLGGAGLSALGHTVGYGARKAFRLDQTDVQLARALEQAVPPELRSPEIQAAINVIDRSSEIDAVNPFAARYADLDHHVRRLGEAMAELEAAPAVVAPPAPRPAVVAAPAAARPAAGGGVDAYLAAAERQESGGDPNARSRTSSASGLFGFTDDTWVSTYRRAFPNSGLSEAAILARKGEVDLQRRLMRQFTQDNAAWLRGRGLADDPANLYVVHHLGQGDAAKVFGAGAGTPLEQILSAKVIAANPHMQGMTAGRFVEWAGERMGSPGSGAKLGETGAIAPVVRPEALDTVRPLVTAEGREVPIASFHPDEIGVDAALMQFKAGGDQFGVTDRLQGVRQWDPISAGVLTVWEGLDGTRLVADGHQRLGLARRVLAGDPAQEIRLNAFVLREADGFSARDARVLTALKNIREGSGTAIDAAKVFRDVGLDEKLIGSLPPRSQLVRDGKALGRLSPDAFGATVNEVIPEGYAAAIGHLAPDPATHMALVDLLAATDPPNRRQAESIIRQGLEAGFARETQDELFGARELTASLFGERAKVLDRTLAELRKLKGAFGVAARNADALDAAGNRIDVSASEAAAAANARALAIVDQLALRKGNGVNAIINRAAEQLAAGQPLARVVRDAVAELRALDLERALRDTGEPGGSARGSGRESFADSEDARVPGEPGPASLDELEAAGQAGFALFDEQAHKAFDDPAGEGIEAVAQSAWHDVRAAAEAADALDAGARLEQWIGEDFDRARAAYEAIDDPVTKLTSEQGRVINTDLARELSPEYRADRTRSSEVHEAASAFVKRLYAEKLAEDPPAGLHKTVLFTAGGTGAGKSSGLDLLGREANDAGIIYDTNMNTAPSAIQKIEQALAAGWQVQIVYTWREPLEALVKGALPRAERMGRTVPLDTHIETHVGARSTIAELAARYADNPDVELVAIDNSRGRGNQELIALENLPEIDHVGLHERATQEVRAAHQRGEISDATARGTLGSAVEGPDPAPRPADRGQPQAADSTPGLEPGQLYDLDDGRGPRSIEEIERELKAWDDGLDAIRGCLA